MTAANPQIIWGEVGERFFETGVDRGLLQVNDELVPWNGITNVEIEDVDVSVTPYFLDGVEYLQRVSSGRFKGGISAFSSPAIFDECDGAAQILPGFHAYNQRRTSFNLAYRTRVGNDVDGAEHAYKIHFIYNALAVPSARSYDSMTEDIEIAPLSWDIHALPVLMQSGMRSSHFTIDSRDVNDEALALIEQNLYGDVDNNIPAKFLTPLEIRELIETVSGYRIVDNGDGTWTAISDDPNAIVMLDDSTFQLNWDTAVYLDADTYTISTY